MIHYIFLNFQSLIQGSVYILYKASCWFYLIIKSLFTHFFDFIHIISWMKIYDFITSTAAFLASCIAIYLFLLRYWPRLWKIVLHTVEFNSSRWHGEQLFVVIENKSLASLTLKNVDLILNNEYRLQISHFDEPFILKPFETVKIGTDHIHSLYAEGKEVSLSDFAHYDKNLLINIYSTNFKYSNLWTGKIKARRDYFSYKQINIVKHSFNKIPYDKDVLYAIQYLCHGEAKTLLVDKCGFCSDDINGINGFPLNVLKTTRELKNFLETHFPEVESFWVTSLSKR